MAQDNIYISVDKEATAEIVEKKSRFIANIRHVETEEEAMSFVDKIKKQHYSARHNVYAYILSGGIKKYTDDGEPSKTAGLPILEMLEKQGITDVVCVVTRYFGGTLLGTGGLVRAYSSSAAENLDGADIRILEMCAERIIEVDYTGIDSVQKFISTHTCSPLSSEYGANVQIKVAVKKTEIDTFSAALTDYMQGRVKITLGKEYYAAFA